MGIQGGGLVNEENTSRYGPLFWTCLLAGWAVIAFGLWTVVSRPGATHPLRFGALFMTVLIVHDGVIAPITLGIGALLASRLPATARSVTQGAAVASAIVVAYSLPLFLGLGNRPDPSVLPRNYGAGLAIVIAVVWLVASVALLRRIGRRA